MSIARPIRKAIRQLIYGDTALPQEFTVSLTEPQTLTTVWLHGLGEPIDVSLRYVTACCAPLLIGLSLKPEDAANLQGMQSQTRHPRLSLQFREQTGEKRLLGVIHLTPKETIQLDGLTFLLSKVIGTANYCLPFLRRWAHFVRLGWGEWRRIDTLGFRMTFLELRAAIVTFIRPHPLSLVSVSTPEGGNLFPMNLMGDLGDGYFAFALKDSRLAAHQVESAGRLAICNLPMPLCSTAVSMAINHTYPAIDFSQLSFPVRDSAIFHLPVPAQAQRVRELEVLKVVKLGSHNLFLARIANIEQLSAEPQVNIIHGFYQYWLCHGDKAKLRNSLAEHLRNKPR